MPDKVLAERSEKYRRYQWSNWFKTQTTSEALFCVLNDDAVVGFALCKPNSDTAIHARGEMHAAYILPTFRGGLVGPTVMMLMADFLHENDMWPSCLWAFRRNKYRRFYTATGWQPCVYRDRVIAGHPLAEIGYISPTYDELICRLERMRASISERQSPRHSQTSFYQVAAH
ncbi:GNAT family N-acetyltransferase [Roseibium sp. TrichSKD4]|uniref:GNAT family N-acetyltransferase n=1 Tax=Roseibium sp. TrichSKD4 TaxID=744980 RepID=UPI0035280C77